DGIRDKLVTGVQTCALPISSSSRGDPVPSPVGQSPTGPTPQLASLGCALRARSSSGHSPKLASRPTILRARSARPSVSERGVEPDGLCPAGCELCDAARCSRPYGG